jgi:microcystin-dependent protein
MMAALAKWRDDNSGILGATGAGSNALVLPTNQGFTDDDYNTAFQLSFSSNSANSQPCTLRVDNASAKPLRRQDGQELGPSDIRPGVIYRVGWHPGTSCFTILSPVIEPAGSIKAFAGGAAVPAGWLSCNGSAVSRAAYAALFSVIGGTWGGGDGSSTFNLPDLRGRSLFGIDDGAGRLTGAGGLGGALGSAGGTETVALTEAQLASHAHGGSTGGAGGHDHGGSVAAAGQHSHTGVTSGAGSHNHTGTTSDAGAHSHTGTTDVSGAHVHPIGYNRSGIFAGSGSNTAVTSIYPGPVNSGGATDDAGTNSGSHQHGLTTSGVGDHAHAFTTGTVAEHAHSITADGQHSHTIPAVGDHSHSVSVTAAGGGQGHGNIPPGSVVIFAIKA